MTCMCGLKRVKGRAWLWDSASGRPLLHEEAVPQQRVGLVELFSAPASERGQAGWALYQVAMSYDGAVLCRVLLTSSPPACK